MSRVPLPSHVHVDSFLSKGSCLSLSSPCFYSVQIASQCTACVYLSFYSSEADVTSGAVLDAQHEPRRGSNQEDRSVKVKSMSVVAIGESYCLYT